MADWPNELTLGALDAFYGDPRPLGANAAWERLNLVTVTIPWRATEQTVKVHKKTAEVLVQWLDLIWNYYERDQSKIDALHLNEIDGDYEPRANRNNPSVPSLHAYGAAIDIAAKWNENGKEWRPNAGMMPMAPVAFARLLGFSWGGFFGHTKDCMHFEFTKNLHANVPFPGGEPDPPVSLSEQPHSLPTKPSSTPTVPALPGPVITVSGLEERVSELLHDIGGLILAPHLKALADFKAGVLGDLDAVKGKVAAFDLLASAAPTPPGAKPPVPPAVQPAPSKTLRGDGSYSFTAEVVGDDIVVRNVVATWFGGPNDRSDNGETASGISTRNNPEIKLVSLPMDGFAHSPLTQGSPLPKIPWHTPVKIKNLATGAEATAPLEELGPSKKAASRAAIDLTEALFTALGGDTRAGRIRVDYTILGGARFVPTAGETKVSTQNVPTRVIVDTQSATGSKINWTQLIALAAHGVALWVGQKFGLDATMQGLVQMGVQAVFSSATIIMRTWFTTTILKQSVPKVSP